ncbi:hypothetical protein QBC42DRAFT_320846 [Cladorrhinum samala]|uniref:Uncharacterized protein n=1 Tax=Cladorrhinum samala TaxID=585594 RepID=A0AAV9HBH0_9PEZI|nr:hypothetical protein QBC42DRAFT_320846 [Cladorrhinum samala]
MSSRRQLVPKPPFDFERSQQAQEADAAREERNEIPDSQTSVEATAPAPVAAGRRGGDERMTVELRRSINASEYAVVDLDDEEPEPELPSDGSSSSSSDDEPDRNTHRRKVQKKRRRKVKPDCGPEFQKALDQYVESMPKKIRDAGSWITEHRPARFKNLDDVQEMLPLLAVGPEWTKKDAEVVEKEWRRDAKYQAMTDIGANKAIVTLHKSCLRLLDCLPNDIISCRFNLEYDSQSNNRQTAKPLMIWIHPMWQGDFRLLALGIQYLVLVDTQDRSSWTLETPDEPLFNELKKVKAAHPNLTVAEARKRATDRVRQGTWSTFPDPVPKGTAEPMWSVLFRTIEEVVEAARPAPADPQPEPQVQPECPAPPEGARKRARPRKPPVQPHEASTPAREPCESLKVKQDHLKSLGRALDLMTHLGFPNFLPVNIYNRGINGRRANADYPVASQMRALLSYSILRERERARWQSKNRIEVASTQEAPGPLTTVDNRPGPGTSQSLPGIPETQKDGAHLSDHDDPPAVIPIDDSPAPSTPAAPGVSPAPSVHSDDGGGTFDDAPQPAPLDPPPIDPAPQVSTQDSGIQIPNTRKRDRQDPTESPEPRAPKRARTEPANDAPAANNSQLVPAGSPPSGQGQLFGTAIAYDPATTQWLVLQSPIEPPPNLRFTRLFQQLMPEWESPVPVRDWLELE